MLFNLPNPTHPFADYAIGRLEQIDIGHFVFREDANVLYRATKYGTNKPEFILSRYEFPSRHHYQGIINSIPLPAEQIERFEERIAACCEWQVGPHN